MKRWRRPQNPYYDGPVTGHFDGARFFNPGHPRTDRSLRDILRWRFGPRPALWPKHMPVHLAAPEPRIAGCRATMVGHATILLQSDGLNVLTDPVWSDRASPVRFAGPRRVTEPGIRFTDLPPIDVVLLSHNHYDHLDTATLRRLHGRDRPHIITPLGNDTIIRRALPDARITTLDWGDRMALPGGAAVAAVPAHHWSARHLRDRRMALWSGFVLQTSQHRIYFAGDTGYGDGAIFRRIRQDFGAPDLALIPIGAYEPRWFMADQHTDAEEAVRIMLDVQARQMLGIHWGCFQLTNEPRGEPAERLVEAAIWHGMDPASCHAAEPGYVLDVEP